MSFVENLKSLLMHRPRAPKSGTQPIQVYLPGDLDPSERYARYEDALENEFQVSGLGRVTGGGSMDGEEREDGTCPSLFSGIDIEVTDIDIGRSMLRDYLPDLGCPPGTALMYRKDGAPLQNLFDGENWLLARPQD